MYQYLIKNGTKLAVYIATFIVVVFLIVALFTGPKINISSGDYTNIYQFNFGLIMGILSLIAIIGISLYFTVIGILSKKESKGHLRTLSIIFAILFIILALIFRSSDNNIIQEMIADYKISPTVNGLISSGIILSIIASVVALGLIIYLELRKIVKA